MGMNGVIGHTDVKKILQESINCGKISHAYIFEGMSGVGRLSLAKAFAEEIAGADKKYSAENNPDITVVTNELYDSQKTQKNILVDTIRAMKSDVYIKPYLSQRKIYIIPNADSMQPTAQNSLLKVFEEPPEYCTIILIAENANSLLQTIRSRAVLVKFHPLDRSDVEKYLIEEKNTDAETAKTISVMSGGSIGRALLLLEDGDAAELRNDVIMHLMNMCKGGHIALYDFIKFLKQNKTSFGLISEIMAEWSSDILHLKYDGNCDIINADKGDDLKKFASAVTKQAAYNFGEIIIKYTLAVKRNANYPIAVQCMATEYWEEINGRNYRSAF